MTTNKAVVDLLERSWKRIEDPKDWCQNAEALDKSGRDVRPQGTAAVRWCAIGALRAERGTLDYRSWNDVKTTLNKSASLVSSKRYINVIHLNDSSTHGMVIRMFKRALKLAKGE